MNRHTSHQPDDLALRQLQQTAQASISADTLGKLRQARHRATTARAGVRWNNRGWWLASACSAVLAVAAALNFSVLTPPHAPPGVEQTPMAAQSDDDALLFDESPELYLWLGSENTLAME